MKCILRVTITCLTLLAGTALAQSYRYGPEVTLYGTLAYSPGETPDGKKYTYPSIELVVPITVDATRGDEDFEPTEKGVMLLQLVLDKKEMTTFKKMKGRRVALSGTLFHSDNGHHQTDVLLDVTSIAAAK